MSVLPTTSRTPPTLRPSPASVTDGTGIPASDTVARPATVAVDCAVFTSARTPTGEGYRIVAATPGLRPEEKAEITRQSPSHGALESEAVDAIGLLAYPLATGRYCICRTRNAGAEHTARGGQRIHTWIAVLTPQQFTLFDRHPLRVQQAMAAALPTDIHPASAPVGHRPPLDRNPSCLQPLLLDVPASSSLLSAPLALLESCVRQSVRAGEPTEDTNPETPPPEFDADVIRQTVGLLECLADSGRSVLLNVVDPTAWLERAWCALPWEMRPAVSVAAGFRFSLDRKIRCTLLSGAPAALQKTLRGQPVQLVDHSGAAKSAPAKHFGSMRSPNARSCALSKSVPASSNLQRWWALIAALIHNRRFDEAHSLVCSARSLDPAQLSSLCDGWEMQEKTAKEASRENEQSIPAAVSPACAPSFGCLSSPAHGRPPSIPG